jgi:hypothetical protein
MQVFSAYFKIIKKHAVSILLYFVIFVVIAMIITNALGGQTTGMLRKQKLISHFSTTTAIRQLWAGFAIICQRPQISSI